MIEIKKDSERFLRNYSINLVKETTQGNVQRPR